MRIQIYFQVIIINSLIIRLPQFICLRYYCWSTNISHFSSRSPSMRKSFFAQSSFLNYLRGRIFFLKGIIYLSSEIINFSVLITM
jgi:hypothetical protein